MKKKNIAINWQIFLSYTILFLIVSTAIVLTFLSNGKTFVWAKDGTAQHFPSLVYIHDFLRDFCANIGAGRWELPMMDFSIGEGMDILTTLNYYGFGDPLTLLAVLFPRDQLELLYGLLIFLRLYLAGISFFFFCAAKGRKSGVAVLIGALAYTFCGYAFYASVRHPFFVNGMLYLPLYLLGVERIFQKRKYGLFSVVVCLSLISNFYFAYMNTILAILYVLFCMLPYQPMKLSWKEKWYEMIRMAGAYLLGVGMSSVIMLPMVAAYLQCSRGGEGGYAESLLFYPKKFYLHFLEAYAVPSSSIGEWTNLGFSVFCMLAVVFLFSKQKKKMKRRTKYWKLRAAYLLLTAMMLVPFAGKVMNGFGYVSNRWNYGYAMLNAYILVVMTPEIYEIVWNEAKMFEKLFHRRVTRVHVSVLLCSLVTINLLFNAVVTYLNPVTSYLDEFEETGQVMESLEDTAIQALSSLQETKTASGINLSNEMKQAVEKGDFYRVEQPWTIGNQSLTMGYFGHNWYFSVAPENYFSYYNSLLMNSMERTYSLRGLDGRSTLNELTATRYYFTSDREDGLVPYGYKLIDTVVSDSGEENFIFENQNFLPLGYTTSAWVSESTYERLSPMEKQETLMQSVVLEDDAETSLMPADPVDLSLNAQQEFCKVVSCSGVTWENNQLNVKEENATVELSFRGMANSETYLWFNKFQVIEGGSLYQVGTVESDNAKNRFVLMNPKKAAWYDEPDQTINLGYSEKPQTSCKITFPEKGIYSMDNFMVIYQPMNNYNAQVNALKSDSLRNLCVETNRIRGEVALSKKKILQMSVPYSQGWKAWVDGEKVEILKSNYMYMALELSQGMHQIEFRYETPYLKQGLVVSGISFLGLIGVIWVQRKREAIEQGKDVKNERGLYEA